MAAPAATTRIMREVDALEKLRNGSDPLDLKFLLDQSPVTNPSSNIILGRILPNSDIFNQAAFQIEIKLPAGYPFTGPAVRCVTPIYHPNVGETHEICLAMLTSGETFKPTTSLTDIVRAVVHLIDNPDLDHALNLGNKSPSSC